VANREVHSIPESLRENLLIWRNRVPSSDDLPNASQLFGPASYQFILYGMGYLSKPEWLQRSQQQDETVRNCLAEVMDIKTRYLRALGPNRDVIRECVSRL